MNQQAPKPPIFDASTLLQKPSKGAWMWLLPLALVLIAAVYAAVYFQWHVKAVAAGAVLIAFAAHVFAWLLSLIALVPIVGPLVVKALSLSLIWLLNALGYCVSFLAIRRGYSKDVLTYRGLTLALLVGIIIGFVLGSLLGG